MTWMCPRCGDRTASLGSGEDYGGMWCGVCGWDEVDVECVWVCPVCGIECEPGEVCGECAGEEESA